MSDNVRLQVGTSADIPEHLRRRIERYTSSSQNHQLGKSLYEDHILELPPFKPVPFPLRDRYVWESDPLNNRSWQWRLNWFAFLPFLISYHYKTGNDNVLAFAADLVTDWSSKYLFSIEPHPFEFIWHDHGSALRAEQLVILYYYCLRFAPEWSSEHQDFMRHVETALIAHGKRLAEDNFYSKHTNHGLEQARVLLLLGITFTGARADQWKHAAIARIGGELEFAFTPEGVHVENSPAYHVFVFKVFLSIVKDYPDDMLGDLAAKFHRFSANALDFITHILRPDRRLPPIGDTEQLPTSDAYKSAFGNTQEYSHFLYAHSQGKRGQVPEKCNVVYPKAGYAIFRNGWPGSDDYNKAFHIVVKAGSTSRYHHQEDEGHISVYAGGEDWLIDSGLYNYIKNDPVRRYMRSRQAHNVPIISNTSYATKFEHRLQNWRITDYTEQEPSPRVTIEIGVLLPIVQKRTVAFLSQDNVLEVQDSFVSDDRGERNFILQWHVPNNKKIVINGQQVVVESRTGSRMLVDMDGPEPSQISVGRGIRDGRVLSCISYKLNQQEPSKVVRVAYRNHETLDVRTSFAFQLTD